MPEPRYWLTTERLALRRFTLEDLDWLCDFYADAEVTQYLGGVKTRAQTIELMDQRILSFYDRHPGLGIWMTVERATSTPVGFHVLNYIHGAPIVQVGFGLLKAHWGRGFASEMGLPLLIYGFRDFALQRIIGIANVGNHASLRVLAKLGLDRKADRELAHHAYASQGPMAWFRARSRVVAA